ncbi:hypothetical protein BCR43DRAFT_346906 [Syncephalastrum racemosum]|uniref:Uncharacterized protein n=1 Tax=Syncephalastrum racemosum TaxID=13706 RepID=A0A1X2H5Z8_SYNRA|nr:hypothetical protein BCR43DRAFT_346906 [Syncephalastrum racemosum]
MSTSTLFVWFPFLVAKHLCISAQYHRFMAFSLVSFFCSILKCAFLLFSTLACRIYKWHWCSKVAVQSSIQFYRRLLCQCLRTKEKP